ncbi:hypothetical protein Nmel_013473 [Mimus melanotis]
MEGFSTNPKFARRADLRTTSQLQQGPEVAVLTIPRHPHSKAFL